MGLEPGDKKMLASAVWQYPRMRPEIQRKLEGWVRVFITERNWEGCGGLELDREMQLSIAGQAGLLALNLKDFYFERITSILVYPDSYIAPNQKRHVHAGVYIQGDSARHGEAWVHGPVVLNWKEVEAGGTGWNDGSNLVIHEFTHHIDSLHDRAADGIPILPAAGVKDWIEVFDGVERRLAEAVAHRAVSVLDPYGLENRAELFAVSMEAFFQHSDWLQEAEPELFSLLRDFFQVDPRIWGPAPDRPD